MAKPELAEVSISPEMIPNRYFRLVTNAEKDAEIAELIFKFERAEDGSTVALHLIEAGSSVVTEDLTGITDICAANDRLNEELIYTVTFASDETYELNADTVHKYTFTVVNLVAR